MNEKTPRISILIPNYNGGKFMRDTLDTIAKQSYQNWEAITMDGESTDDSCEILEEYAKDSRFRVFSESDNGPYHAIHKALAKARGEFVCIVAISDGYLDRDWFKKALNVMDDDIETSLVWGIPMDMTEDGILIGPNYIYAHFLQNNDTAKSHNVSIFKKIFNKFNILKPTTFFTKINKTNIYALRYMIGGKRAVPQKKDWFFYWLKTGRQFPDGNMIISKRVYNECLPSYGGKSEPGHHLEFYYNFNSRGYLARCIPTPVSIGRIHEGQRNDTLQSVNDAGRRIYLSKVKKMRRRYKKSKSDFVFRDRNGGTI